MDFVKRVRWLVGAVAVALLLAGHPALAADASAPAPYSWTGFYIGGFVGGAFDGSVVAHDNGGGGFTCWNCSSPWHYRLGGSFIGGAEGGYNFQIAPVVLGLENEVGFLSMKGSRADPQSPGRDTHSDTTVGQWFDVLSGRVGIAFDRWLVYAKGGVAFTQVESHVVDACTTGSCGGGAVSTSGSKTIVTGAGGAGAEYAITNNWSYKLEYLFINLNSSVNTSGPATAGGATGAIFNFKHTVNGVHTFKLGINYKF